MAIDKEATMIKMISPRDAAGRTRMDAAPDAILPGT
jgi:hypothetical protein